MIDAKDKELNNIVRQLCENQSLNKIKDEIIEKLKEIYTEEYRHKYSEITTIIINSKDVEQTSMTFTQNFRLINEEFGKEEQSTNIKLGLEKLYDHINLECIRLQDSDNKINEIKDVSNELDRNYKALKQNLNKQQIQYITILGIFASIVLAFVGGLVFSTSVLSNIDKASIYRLLFVIAFIALFFGNILYLLFNFLSKIALVKDDQEAWLKKPIYWFNIITIILIAVGFAGEI
ncbi:hypothetical protein [Helicobacter mesocricetorum]|uniref:hypothetical protein n=1 Tax=Helicobacter mesocricetorum TaxID=87012 RepID=UPI001F2EB2A4|nr:hypothetical protein [Helicobacter mesocricetorum]